MQKRVAVTFFIPISKRLDNVVDVKYVDVGILLLLKTRTCNVAIARTNLMDILRKTESYRLKYVWAFWNS